MEFSDSYTKSLREEYDQNGFVKFEQAIPADEAREIGNRLKELIEDIGNNAQWQTGDHNDAEERTKTKILDVHDVHLHPEAPEKLKSLRYDPRIMGRLGILLGGPVVNHHDKGFVKPGVKGETYGGKFPLHQDYPFFPHFDPEYPNSDIRMLAAILYLTDIDEDMGPVQVYRGSHKLGLLEHKRGDKHEPYIEDETPFSPEDAVTVTGNAGTMVAFNLNTVHKSGPNKSPRDRTSLLYQVRHELVVPLYGEELRQPAEGELLWTPTPRETS